MTSEYPCGQPTTSPHLVDFAVAWTHSIVSEQDFVSPWEASSRALELSFDLSTLPDQGNWHNTFDTKEYDTKSQCDRITDSRSLRFSDDIEVLIGIDDCWKMSSFSIQHHDLCQNSLKPWGWFFSSDTWQYDRKHDYYKPEKKYRSERMNRSALEPQLNRTALIRQNPSPLLLRITDQWHRPLPEDVLRQGHNDEELENDPDVIPDPAGAPTFVQDLFEMAERHRVFTDLDSDEPMRIRTWYIHHQDERYCDVPRFLEFEEDWRRWETDIGLAWRDRIRPNEVIMIHVVFPDSFRGYLERPVHADVIISQGQWLHRYSALTTIHHHHRLHPPFSYAVASSLPRRIGGVLLAEAARVLYWCNQPGLRCRSSYEWHDIPFTMAPTHIVEHGHAFNINIIDVVQIDKATSSTDPRPRKRQFLEIDESSFLHQPEEDDETAPDEADEQVPTANDANDYASSSLHSGDIGLLIYRLSEPDAHSFAPSTTYMAILSEAIRACGARRRDTRCFHYVPATPTGVHPEAEEVIILQSIHDVATESDEKLVLLDLEIHFHPLRGGLLVPAATSRKVIKVNPTLHRDQLLLLTGLFEYCRLQHDRCTIFKNNELWPANDVRVHTMTHGTYLKIQVPPPQDPTLDTEVAIAIARDFALEEEPERTNIAARCRQPSSTPSSLSLRQIASTPQSEPQEWEPTVLQTDHNPQVRTVHLPAVPLQRHRGYFAEGHKERLIRLGERADLIECEEEGWILYVTVWLIHHQQQVRCDEGRSARLGADHTSWIEEIAETWRESLDPQHEFVIHLVQPTPACSRFECVQAHLIIEQAVRPHFTVCLISLLDERRREDAWSHRAYATTALQSTTGVLRLTELTTICSQTICQVTLRDFPLSVVDYEELDPALNIVIKLQHRHGRAGGHDVVDLMQRTMRQPNQQAVDINSGHQECDRYATGTLNPFAPPFHPDRPNLWDQTEDIHALHQIWLTGVNEWHDGVPSASFHVWFLCPGGGILRCLYPRRVTLNDDVTEWRDRLQALWSDQVLPGFPFEIHVVQPTPYALEEGIAAHILMTQLFIDQTSGALLTVQDNSVNEATPFRIAVTLPNPGQLQSVRDIAGYANEQALFTLSSGTQTFGPHQHFPIRHGKSLHMLVHRPNLPPGALNIAAPLQQETDGVGLLQTAATITKGVSERLTHDAVAQAHGPETPCMLHLEQLIPNNNERGAARLVPGRPDLLIPTFIEMNKPFTENQVEQELRHWGVECKAVQFGLHEQFLCLDTQTAGSHYLLCNEDLTDSEGCILHTHESPLDTVGLMKILDSLGYARAVILAIEDVGFGHTRVNFYNNDPKFNHALNDKRPEVHGPTGINAVSH